MCVGCADEDGEWTGDALDRKDLERSEQFPHLGAAFRTNVEQFGPNDFFVMQKCMKEVRFICFGMCRKEVNGRMLFKS